MASDNPVGNAATAEKKCELRLLYLKDMSFESPHVPGVLFGHEQPECRLEIDCKHKLRDKDLYEVILDVSVHGVAGDRTLFLIEVKQGGLFEISGYNTEETVHLLQTRAPESLYPYARELISSMVSRGGFPRMWLRPLNFQTLYAESRRKRQQEAAQS